MKERIIARLILWLIRYIGGDCISGDLVEELRRIATDINVNWEKAEK